MQSLSTLSPRRSLYREPARAACSELAASAAGGVGDRHYRAWALAVVMLGLTLTGVDTTIVVLAQPVIMAELYASMLLTIWIILAYLLTLTVLSTQVGRLGDLFGRVNMYNLGFAVFTLGSVLCGLGQTADQLVAFRVVQAIGGALISANSCAIIADTVEADQRGSAYGLTGIGFNAGAILGILLGGVLITLVGWRWIFFINLPLGLVALAIGRRVLRERSPRVRQRLDWPGVILLGAGLLLILLAANDIAGSGWATSSGIELATGGVLLVSFVGWEHAFASPLFDLSLLRNRVLSGSVSAAFFQALGAYAVLFLVIMYLQGVRGLSPLHASLLLVPGYIVGGSIGPWAGKLSDKIGARLPASAGLLLGAMGILLYRSLSLTSPLWTVVLASTLTGIGNGLFYPANNSAVMASAPAPAYGVVSGLLRMLANVGMVGSFAVALVLAFAAIPRQQAFAIFLGVSQLTPPLAQAFVDGLHSALLASIGLVLVACVLSLLRGREQRARTMSTARRLHAAQA